MSTAATPYESAPEPDPVLADRDVVDDYALRRRRLTGAMARGRGWRVRPERPVLPYLALGAVLALLALLIVGMVAFVKGQMATQTPVQKRAACISTCTGWGADDQWNRAYTAA